MKVGLVNQDAKQIQENLAEAFGKMVGYTTCWEDSLGFESISQASVRIAVRGETVDLPFYNSMESEDLKAYKAAN